MDQVRQYPIQIVLFPSAFNSNQKGASCGRQTSDAPLHLCNYPLDYIEFVYKVHYLRCCSNFKSSNTLVFCGLKFSHASILNFLSKLLKKVLLYRQALHSLYSFPIRSKTTCKVRGLCSVHYLVRILFFALHLQGIFHGYACANNIFSGFPYYMP